MPLRGFERATSGISFWFTIMLVACGSTRLAADEGVVVGSQTSSGLATVSIDSAKALASVQWLAALAVRKAPRTYDGDKDWGKTKQLWAGVKIRRDGWKLKTNRRFREVEHGRWVRYEVTMPEPSSVNAPEVTVDRVMAVTDRQSAAPRWKIESSIAAPMYFTARIQRWNFGVKVYSMTVSGHMRVRMTTTATVGFLPDYGEIPPGLVIDPRIEQAHLSLEQFEVDRVSRIGGEAAEQWGEMVEEIILDRFIEKQNDRIVAKLNKSIDKERDDLKFSLAEWFDKW